MAQSANTVATLVEILHAQLAARHTPEELAQLPTLAAETDLLGDLALESVQVMEFMVDVEDHFDVAIDLESLAKVQTLAQLAAVVEAELKA